MIILIYLVSWISLNGAKNTLKRHICKNYKVNKSSELFIYELNKKYDFDLYDLKIESDSKFASFDYKNQVMYCNKCLTTRHDEIVLLHEFFHYFHSRSIKDRTIVLYSMFKIISLIMFPVNAVLVIFLKDYEFLLRLNIVLLTLNIVTVLFIYSFENQTNTQLLIWINSELSKSEKKYLMLNQYLQVFEWSFLIVINLIVLITLTKNVYC